MHPSAFPVVFSVVAACLLSTPLAAQSGTPLDRGKTLSVQFADDAPPGADVSHTYEYSRRIRRGATVYVHVWGSSRGQNGRLAPRVAISDPDADGDLSRTTHVQEYTDASITASKTFDRAGRVLIRVSRGTPLADRGYTIRVEEAAARRSATSGPHLAAGYGTTSLKMVDTGVEYSGQGLNLRLGAGLSRALSVIAEGQVAEMSPTGAAPDDGTDGYTLYHTELGARLYLVGSWSWLRPYVQGAYGGRMIKVATRDVRATGRVLTPGGGLELFLRPGFSVEGGVRRSFGEITSWKKVDGEWRDIPGEHDLDAETTRVQLQAVIHF